MTQAAVHAARDGQKGQADSGAYRSDAEEFFEKSHYGSVDSLSHILIYRIGQGKSRLFARPLQSACATALREAAALTTGRSEHRIKWG